MISRPHAASRWLRLTTVAVEAAATVLGDGEGLQPGIVAIWVVDETDRRHVWFDHVNLLQGVTIKSCSPSRVNRLSA